MPTIQLILLILACICFLMVAGDVKAPRINLLGLGLTFWVLSILLIGR